MLKKIKEFLSSPYTISYHVFLEFLLLSFFVGMFLYSQICEVQCTNKFDSWIEENEDILKDHIMYDGLNVSTLYGRSFDYDTDNNQSIVPTKT